MPPYISFSSMHNLSIPYVCISFDIIIAVSNPWLRCHQWRLAQALTRQVDNVRELWSHYTEHTPVTALLTNKKSREL